MKTRLFLTLVLALVLAGCSRPKTIPDDDLKQIMKEIYLANAFVNTKSMKLDTTEIYAPIFEKYGYDLTNFRYTIQSYSKRKSSRFSDVIDETITDLTAEFTYYEGKVAMADTVDKRLAAKYRKTILSDSLIVVNRVADTAKLRIELPVEAGAYTVSYNYYIDSLDKNGQIRSTVTLIDSVGSRRTANTQWLRVKMNKSYVETQIETTPAHRKMALQLGNYPKDMKKPNMRIDSLRITHTLPKDVARDSLIRTMWNFNTVLKSEYDQENSFPLSVDSVRFFEGRDSIR